MQMNQHPITLTTNNKNHVYLTQSKPKSSVITSIHSSVEKRLNPQSTYIEGLSQSNIKSSSMKKDHSIILSKGKQNDFLWSADKKNSRSLTLFVKSDKNKNLSQSKTIQLNPCKQKTNNNKAIIQTILSKQQQHTTCTHHYHHNKPWFDLEYHNQYPFKPQISSSLPKDIYPQQQSIKMSKQQRFERLVENLRKKHVERLEERLEKEKQMLDKQCKFQPNQKNKNKNKEQIQQQKTQLINNFNIHQKLYLQSLEIKQNKKKNQQSIIQQQNQQIKKFNQQQQKRYKQSKQKLSQLIQTNKNQQKLQQLFVPIYNRVEKVNQNKKIMVDQLRQKYYGNKQQQQKKKKKISEKKSQQLVKRLVDDYLHKKAQQQLTLQQTINKQLQQTCPFTPILQITDLHRNRITTNKKPNNSQLSLSQKQYTFIPKINDTSKVIVENLYYQNKRGDQYIDVGERLCYMEHDIGRIKKLQKIKEEMDYECTFAPVINNISKQLVYNKTFQTGLRPPVHHCPQPQSIIQQNKQLIFQPQINQKSKCMTQKEKILFLQRKNQKSKQKLNKIFNHLQYKQVEQCTFYPKTISTTKQWKKWKQQNLKNNKLIIKQKSTDIKSTYNKIQQNDIKHIKPNNIVKGLQTFMRNCENVKRKKIDHQQRLNKIFNFQQKYNQRLQKQHKKL